MTDLDDSAARAASALGTPAAAGGDGHAARGHPRSAAAGIALVLASAICFGTLPIFARIAYDSGADTSTVLLLRFSAAAAIMWTVLRARGAALPRGKGLAMLVGMGGIGYAGQAFSYFTAVDLGSAGLAALLLYLYPAVVAILSRVVFRHPLSLLQALAIGMALVGSLLTIGRAGDGTPLGVLFGVLAALIYSVYILTGARLPAGITATASTTVVTSSAAVVFAGVVLARGAHLPQTALGLARRPRHRARLHRAGGGPLPGRARAPRAGAGLGLLDPRARHHADPRRDVARRAGDLAAGRGRRAHPRGGGAARPRGRRQVRSGRRPVGGRPGHISLREKCPGRTEGLPPR